ncbi:hypothetical protein PCA31118_05272 [Pandoraea captiosa]|uniref:Uncharacterized protein n=1 Tax=Pandoraea captiosa TaxID=2508302 RepID=A0A5E5AWY0_9BURK|nr:hypothetical protein PCA31118_05272 [Pandoraea captiosa]
MGFLLFVFVACGHSGHDAYVRKSLNRRDYPVASAHPFLLRLG